MELRVPENLDFFEIMTPGNSQPEDVIPGGQGIRLTPNRPNIMIYKIGGDAFHVLYFVFDASQPVRVIFERETAPDDVRVVSKYIEVLTSK